MRKIYKGEHVSYSTVTHSAMPRVSRHDHGSGEVKGIFDYGEGAAFLVRTPQNLLKYIFEIEVR